MGRYVPPEHEGVTSANKLAGKHPLGARARKSGQGILTVRFEMPFPIWCNTCPKPTIIGQGVRFNAEKKKVGSYFSTPIFSFRMKHSVCDGWIEIRTDPKNTAYVVTEGAKKRETGEDKVLDGEIRLGMTEEDRARLENDPFAALESKVKDKNQAASDKSRIEQLYRTRERDWDDPGEANRKLRRGFRTERKVRQRKELATETLRDRLGLAIELLEEDEDDKERAKLIDFGATEDDSGVAKAQSRPLFDQSKSMGLGRPRNGKGSVKKDTNQKTDKLKRELGNNTRTALDPFLGNRSSTLANVSYRQLESPLKQSECDMKKTQLTRNGALVDYDSD